MGEQNAQVSPQFQQLLHKEILCYQIAYTDRGRESMKRRGAN